MKAFCVVHVPLTVLSQVCICTCQAPDHNKLYEGEFYVFRKLYKLRLTAVPWHKEESAADKRT